jgi:hypothetical protein
MLPSLNSPEIKDKPLLKDIFNIFMVIIVFYAICTFLYAFGHTLTQGAPYNIGEGLKIFANALLIAIAAFCIGTFAGFLLGLPKTVVSTNPKNSGVVTNTNLEQVSDWITKVLVGFSLAKLSNIKATLLEIIEMLKIAVGNTDYSAVYGTATAIIFLFCGFIAAYLITRISLPSFLDKKNA